MQSAIQQFPAALNQCRHCACPHRVAQSEATVDKVIQDVARKGTRRGKYDNRVDTAVSYVNRATATVA